MAVYEYRALDNRGKGRQRNRGRRFANLPVQNCAAKESSQQMFGSKVRGAPLRGSGLSREIDLGRLIQRVSVKIWRLLLANWPPWSTRESRGRSHFGTN